MRFWLATRNKFLKILFVHCLQSYSPFISVYLDLKCVNYDRWYSQTIVWFGKVVFMSISFVRIGFWKEKKLINSMHTGIDRRHKRPMYAENWQAKKKHIDRFCVLFSVYTFEKISFFCRATLIVKLCWNC